MKNYAVLCSVSLFFCQVSGMDPMWAILSQKGCRPPQITQFKLKKLGEVATQNSHSKHVKEKEKQTK